MDVPHRAYYWLRYWPLRRRLARRYRENQLFDQEHGIETAAQCAAIPVPGGVHYAAVHHEDFRRAMSGVEAKGRVFVDLGSGKGKAVYLASLMGFERCIGVEYSDSLHQIAIRNLQGRGTSICQDAMSFEFPREPLVVFLFNPFGEELMERMVGRLSQSWSVAPRPITLVYVNPTQRHLFDAVELFHIVDSGPHHVTYKLGSMGADSGIAVSVGTVQSRVS